MSNIEIEAPGVKIKLNLNQPVLKDMLPVVGIGDWGNLNK
jgi:hypothetical protein